MNLDPFNYLYNDNDLFQKLSGISIENFKNLHSILLKDLLSIKINGKNLMSKQVKGSSRALTTEN